MYADRAITQMMSLSTTMRMERAKLLKLVRTGAWSATARGRRKLPIGSDNLQDESLEFSSGAGGLTYVI